MNKLQEDRLYELLPTVYRMRDAAQGEPLKALLRVITEQVNLVEKDIAQLYENWFIETCEDWVVPYIGDLIGYEPVHEAGEPSAVDTPQGEARNKILIPRRELANTIRYRRRKGTLALLELLAGDVAGWPTRAVEFYKLLGITQALNHGQLDRGQTVDLRKGSTLALLNGPFDQQAHTVDVRRIHSQHSRGRYNIPSVGLFVWRLKSYSVTETPAYCLESAGPHCYTFSVLGNDAPLYMRPEAEADPTQIAGEFNLPVPIRRRLFEEELSKLYGDQKSLQIWKGLKRGKKIIKQPVPLEQIVPTDLSDWHYLPRRGTIAVDPKLGRIAFPSRQLPKHGVWVRYQYGFSSEIGGGEYGRTTLQAAAHTLYLVGKGHKETIRAALAQWQEENPQHAVIEITDSGVYVEPIHIEFKKGQKSLQLRAANRKRPVIRLLDWQTDQPDALTVTGTPGSCFTLDGLLVTGRGIQIGGDLADFTLRHSTLVPGWTLDSDCEPQRGAEASLEINSPKVCVKIEHSILGTIQVDPSAYIPIEEIEEEDSNKTHESDDEGFSDKAEKDPHCDADEQKVEVEIRLDPIQICISDSILDATDPELEAIGAPGCLVAHVYLTIKRCTVFGQVQVHAVQLGENTIFEGRVMVARRQKGCLRFCYVTPGSRTPRRYRCQPDLVVTNLIDEEKRQEERRVKPLFNSVRYGTPTYCQLSDCCAEEIKRGADDESEMGVFHDLFQAQRAANLRVRLDEYLPARMDAGIIIAT